eukprot:3026469-Pyramimonas_sp.AAC.1
MLVGESRCERAVASYLGLECWSVAGVSIGSRHGGTANLQSSQPDWGCLGRHRAPMILGWDLRARRGGRARAR